MFRGHGQFTRLVLLYKCVARYHSTGVDPQGSLIRNIALMAHIDSGKTTLTESILLASSFIKTPGTVDTGSTTTDFLPAERERGITIQSASIPVRWKDWTFNLIDTPGHADFGMEVECASRVIDGVVVLVDTVQGVEAQTKGVWKQLDRHKVKSRILFCNKLDRAGAAYRSSLLSVLTHRLHPRPMVLTLPITSFDSTSYTRAEPGVVGVVDLVNWEVWRWHHDGVTRHKLPASMAEIENSSIFSTGHPLIEHLIPARVSLLESISMMAEPLMEQLLQLPSPDAYATIEASEIIPHLRNLTVEGKALPVICGSAMKHVGVQILMDYVGQLLASPVDTHPNGQPPNTSHFQALAWKVAWDKRRGWMTFVRVYSGILRSRVTLMNVTRDERERPSKLLLLYANQEVEVDSLPNGTVGVVLGLKHTRTGDTLCSLEKVSRNALVNITPPPAVISSSLIPHSPSDEHPLYEAVNALSRTDPSVRTETNDGQLLINAMGPLHLEIVEGRLRDEWGVRFELGPRRVTYCESLQDGVVLNISDEWRTEIHGATVAVKVTMSVRPLDTTKGETGEDAWGGNTVKQTAFADSGDYTLSPSFSDTSLITYKSALTQGILNTLSNSPNSLLPLTNLHIVVVSIHMPPTAPPICIAGAVAYILNNAIKSQGVGALLEPFINLKVDVEEAHVGPVIRDIIEHGGEILELEDIGNIASGGTLPYTTEGIYIPPDWITPCSGASNAMHSAVAKVRRIIHANGPLAQFLDYTNRFRALTGGNGLFESSNRGYRRMGDVRRLEVLKDLGKL